MKKAFTLIEVNLAMMIMATGILTVVGLYAFGYRESRQSTEDVAATALADVVVGQLMTALTATNVTWTSFNNLGNYPSSDGWKNYFNSDGVVESDPTSQGRSVFSSVMGQLNGSNFDKTFPSAAVSSSDLKFGLVVLHDKDSPIVRIAFRATKLPGSLLAMPLYYTEARFQGDPTK